MASGAKTLLFGIGAFLLPAAVLTLAAVVCGIAPLGPNLFMLNDMNAQYVDFFAWYRDVLTGQADPFYSTAQSFGQNMMATFSYYVASPLNVLVLAFDERDIPAFFFVLTLIKAGLAQLTMVYYLRRRFPLSRPWACALALGYALSLWTVMQMRNIMWLDAMVLVPLCAWGVCCLLRSGRWRLLALSTAGAVITCWYMGYMVILFLCLYVLFEGYVLSYEGVPSAGRMHRKRLCQFAGCMALALALSAFLFAPTVLGMMGDGASSDEGSLVSSLQTALDGHLPWWGLSAEGTMAAASACVLIVAAACCFAFRRFSLRRRVAGLLAAALGALSLMALFVPAMQQESLGVVVQVLLTGTWEGALYGTDNVPQLFASTLVTMLCIALFASKRVPLKLKLACGLFLALLIASTWLRPLMIIWGGMRFPHGYQNRMAFLVVFMLVWCAAYAVPNVLAPWAARARNPESAGFSHCCARLFQTRWSASAVLALTVAELCVRTCFACGSLYQEGLQAWVDEYYDSALVQAAELEERDPGIYRVEKANMRYNTLGFNEGLTYGFNQLASYSSTNSQAVLAFLSDLGYGNAEYCTYDLEPTLPGDSLFGVKYLSAQNAPEGFIDAGLHPVDGSGSDRFWENPYALPLAYCVPADILSFSMPEGDRWERLNAFAAAAWGNSTPLYPDAGTADAPSLDMDAFQQMIDQLEEHGFTFDEFGGSHISGTVNAGEGQVLLMTIPNQDGWSVTVNGEAVQPEDVADGALMAIPVTAGEDRVEMRFTTPGLWEGVAISILAALFMLIAPAIRQRIPNRVRPS